MLQLQKTDILQMLETACKAVSKNRRKIDDINVFPVPDADTGSNLARTLSEIEGIIQKRSGEEHVLDKVLESALKMASGNSGIMITAYLSDFLIHLKDKDELEISDFENAFDAGAKAARSAVESPKSGTMLDVMDAYADEFKKTKSFKKAQVATIKSLKKTEGRMKILAQNHVVDAGALGFCIFIFAFTNKQTKLKFDPTSVDSKPVRIEKIKDLGKYYYEVIFIVSDCAFTITDIKDMFTSMGDSIDVLTVEEKVKLHIHTNEPGLVEETAGLLGNVESIQTVDMRREHIDH